MHTAILEKKYGDILVMLDYCYEAEEPVTVEELSVYFDLSPNKVLRLFELCKAELGNATGDFGFEITIHDKKDVDITFEDYYTSNRIYAIFFKKSISRELLMEMYAGQFHSGQSFAARHQISGKTLNRKLSAVKSLLENYSIQLDMKFNDPLQGAEHQIRLFFYMLSWQTFFEDGQFYSEENEQNLWMIERKMMTLMPRLELVQIRKFQQALELSLLRIQQEKYITVKPRQAVELQNYYLSYEDFMEQLFEPFLERNQLDLGDYLETEGRFHYYYLATTITYTLEDVQALDYRLFRIYDLDCYATETFIQRFSKYFNLPLTQEVYLYLYINLRIVHSFSSVFNGSYQSFGKRNDLDYFFNEFPELYALILQFYKEELADGICEDILSRNNRLLYQYCLIVRPVFEQFRKPVKIHILSKISHIQSRWQGAELIRLTRVPIEIVDRPDESCDFFISDFPILNSPYYTQQVERLVWGPIQKSVDWTRIVKRIEEKSFLQMKEDIGVYKNQKPDDLSQQLKE